MIFVYRGPRRKLRRKFRLILPGFIYRWSRWVDVPVNQRGSLWIFSNQEIVTRLFSRSERRVPDDHANYRAGRNRRSYDHPYSPFSVFHFLSRLHFLLCLISEEVWKRYGRREHCSLVGNERGQKVTNFSPVTSMDRGDVESRGWKRKAWIRTARPPAIHPSPRRGRSGVEQLLERREKSSSLSGMNHCDPKKGMELGSVRTTGIIEKKLKFERESRKRHRKVRGMRERGGKRRWGWWRRRWRGGDEAWLKSPARQKTQIDQNESYAGQKKVNEQDGSHAFRASGEFSETRQ